MSRVRPLLVLPLVFFSLLSLAQTPAHIAPLPADPMELATGSTILLNTPENRTLILGLLERARQSGSELYALGGPPFALKVSFTATGASSYTGSGEMDEVRYSRSLWRWSARLGDYSQRRVFQEGVPYDEKTPGPIPLRLQMVRGAVLWSMARLRPGAAMRMASAKWEGLDVMCALLSPNDHPVATPGREWDEQEYCVDTRSALLRVYSEAPGIYVAYDYKDALQFHGRILARQITISEGGAPVMQIHVDSIDDPGRPDPGAFTPSKEMLARGPGIVLHAPIRLMQPVASPSGYAGILQPVIVHAALDYEGKVVEAEVLQNSDSNLTNAALAAVRKTDFPVSGMATGPLQYEAFLEVVFGGAQ